jgi:hypothetical protein
MLSVVMLIVIMLSVVAPLAKIKIHFAKRNDQEQILQNLFGFEFTNLFTNLFSD